MDKIIAILFFLSLHFLALSQDRDSIYLWQGFKHEWTYNHRINRIGNFLSEDKKEIIYTAASGLGADSTYYTSKYSLITNSGLNAFYGREPFEILGKEGEKLTLSQEIKVPLSEEDQGKKVFPFLNGFDLLSIKKADKLEIFDINISQVEQGVITDFITIKIDIIFQANCSTLECQWFNQKVAYQLDVDYLVLFAKRNEIKAKTHNTAASYNWDKKNEIYNSKSPNSIINKESDKNNIIGIRQFSIEFDKEHWIKEWNVLIDDSKSTTELNLFYKEWSAKMKKESAYPKHSRFSKRGKGEVELRANLLVLSYPKKGKIESIISKGKMFWRGKNKSANSEAAVDRKRIR